MSLGTGDVERRLLAACLLHPPVLRKVAAEVLPEEFTDGALRATFEVMIAADTRDSEWDDVTLIHRLTQAGLRDPAKVVSAIYGAPTNPRAWPEYTEILHEQEQWHRTDQASGLLAQSFRQRDYEMRTEAIRVLATAPGGGWEESVESLQDAVTETLEGNSGPAIPLPFHRLSYALGGGLRPGEVTVIGGWTSHAKSVLAMQTADLLVQKGGDALYLTNEMRRDEVALRVMAGHQDSPSFPSLRPGEITESQWSKLLPAIAKLAMKIVDCAGRTCEEICAFIMARRPDLAIIDLFNRLPTPEAGGTRERDDQVNRICDAAARSGSATLLISQLNRGRVGNGKELPHPTLGDLRDTGYLATHPANVLFSYLTEEDGVRDGYVEVAKARNGEVGVSVPVTLNPGRMRLVMTNL